MNLIGKNQHKNALLAVLWKATRPRTFPLAAASIICGNGLAYHALNGFDLTHWCIFLLTLWVALCLQILSNLANDYGDGVSGADNLRDAQSPERITVTGQINANDLKKVIYYWGAFTFFCGVLLIYLGLETLNEFLVFLSLGILAIIAACAYTMGKRPYGYRALGEASVLMFFGWLGVLGSCYLQLHYLEGGMILPATGCGLLSAGVLYVNNMRDIDSDKLAKKTTIAVLLGKQTMALGYYVIILLAMMCYFAYARFNSLGSLLWLLVLPFILKHLIFVYNNRNNPQQLGTQLKTVVMSTLAVNLLFVVGLLLI
ncbi:1,4-dihydroxy-2-naphthoate octaprenyltransferase [Psychrobacter sp. HD31]|uniref:1,4-dihydroxy-2-naphthoate octaprenyltransferase n=1 Tax=Psychrobacter sp. HD31 TaxID=3112003 RepID=UPI003DA1F006